MDRQTDRWINRQMDKQTDGWTDGLNVGYMKQKADLISLIFNF